MYWYVKDLHSRVWFERLVTSEEQGEACDPVEYKKGFECVCNFFLKLHGQYISICRIMLCAFLF